MGNNTTQQSHFNLYIKGLPEYEQKVITATAKISHSRPLALHLVNEMQAQSADVIVIDGTNSEALLWAQENQSWLQKKIVIWIDTPAQKLAGHITLKRPVLWVNLPIIITRILDDIETKKVATPKPAKPSPTLASSEKKVASKAHILICDDSQAVRLHLATLLEERHYEITVVDCGEAAIAAIKKQSFDCVLMDVLMPGIDGYRACREILRLGQRNIPVIMLTSKTSPFDKIRGKMSGCSAYLTKPVTMQNLIQAIERYTQRK